VDVFCSVCPQAQFSLGGVDAACVGCPQRGARCVAGILQLQRNFFRPPAHGAVPLGPSTELHPCVNGEACVVNDTTRTYGCRAGYRGPLCGVVGSRVALGGHEEGERGDRGASWRGRTPQALGGVRLWQN
jgi:hypothetical protein